MDHSFEQAQDLDVLARHLTHPAAATTEPGCALFTRVLEETEGQARIGIGCSNDLFASGALFEAQRCGRRIPEDYAVTGFGDLGFAASCNLALSTIRPVGELIGAEAARLIAQQFDQPDSPRDTISDTGYSVMHRQST